MSGPCEYCVYFVYNEDIEDYECLVDLDEDEVYRFHAGGDNACPYFRADDEYGVVRHQN